MSDLILLPNPIPPEMHGRNLRSILPQDDWDILRTDCYMKADYLCEICGGVGPKHPVECHEEWEFNREKKTQTLIVLMAICPMCHLVKHIGRAAHLGKFEKVFKHFCKVNKIKRNYGEDIFRDLLNSYQLLLGINYKIDITMAKDRILELQDEHDTVLSAFPIIKKG